MAPICHRHCDVLCRFDAHKKGRRAAVKGGESNKPSRRPIRSPPEGSSFRFFKVCCTVGEIPNNMLHLFLITFRFEPLFPSLYFSPGPPPAAALLPCPLVLYSTIAHFCLLVVQIAPRPYLVFGAFFSGGNEGHSPRSMETPGMAAAVFKVTPAKQIPPTFSACFFLLALFFVYRNFTTLARIPTFSPPIIMFYFACLMDS